MIVVSNTRLQSAFCQLQQGLSWDNKTHSPQLCNIYIINISIYHTSDVVLFARSDWLTRR